MLSKSNQGYSFVELLVVSTILAILASVIAPLSKVAMQRQHEIELRRALRQIRVAIDRYKDAVDLGVIGGTAIQLGNEGYPANLETLVEGVELLNDGSNQKLKLLRRIPIDPMTQGTEWGLRSYQDEPGALTWGGDNVYDVYSTSLSTALDGTRYRDW